MSLNDTWNFNPTGRSDARQITTFFLGALFIQSIRSTFFSSFVQRFFPFPGGHSYRDSISERSTTRTTRAGYLALDVLLPISFCVTSVAHFSSLLAFESDAQVGCAFVVALGGIFQQLARLLASIIILFDLRPMMFRAEVIIIILWLLLGAASAFLDNALATGFLIYFQPLQTSLCVRKRVLPPAAVSFGLYSAIQLYFIARAHRLFLPPSESQVTYRNILLDPRLLRPLSLLLLEILSFLPIMISLDVTGQFIPLSIAGLIVLAAFRASPHSTSLTIPISAEKPSSQKPTFGGSPQLPRLDSPVLPSTSPVVGRYESSPIEHINHPFAATALKNPSMMQTSGWLQGHGIDQSRTSLTDSEAGVVQVARKSFSPHEQAKVTPKLIGLPPTPKSTRNGRRKGYDRRIATPDMIASFEIDDKELPTPTFHMTGVPPPPTSAHTRLVVQRGSVASQSPSLNSTKIYGSDIIRITSTNSQRRLEDRTKRPRYSTASYSRMSHQTFVTDAYSVDVSNSRDSYNATNSSSGHDYYQSVKRWPTFGGKPSRGSSLQTKKQVGGLLGVDIPTTAMFPPPLPSSVISPRPRPLPSTPTHDRPPAS